MKKLVLASNNAGKLREFGALLAPLGIELLPQSAFGVGEAEEPHPTFVENALAKARIQPTAWCRRQSHDTSPSTDCTGKRWYGHSKPFQYVPNEPDASALRLI